MIAGRYIILNFIFLFFSMGCDGEGENELKVNNKVNERITVNNPDTSEETLNPSDKPADTTQSNTIDTENSISGTDRHPAFRRLKDALNEYQSIANDGGWPTLPGDLVLNVGDKSEHVSKLRERLALTDDISASVASETDNVYDQALSQGVRNFQDRHGIKVDGIVGPGTVEHMNIPVQQKIEKLNFSLDSWRDLPEDLGERYIMVNVPEFRLRAFNNSQKDLEMKVIVGAEYNGRETPLFNDKMQHLIFSPYWNVPASIAANEIIPNARGNRSFLPENNYVISSSWGPGGKNYDPHSVNLDRVLSGDLKLKQKPGPGNALGLVKFMFPNQYAVYLHGTPKDHLFEERERGYSHGCIRVENPVDLALFALENNSGWTRQDVVSEMNNGEWRQVDLSETIPVYIIYYLAYVDEDGTVNFSDDLYDKT